jgi:predicted Zn-dependent protease
VKIPEYREAAVELEKLLIREPSNSSLRRVLAYAYRKTGRYREAAVFLKALLREKPLDLGLLLEYAGCMEKIGRISHVLVVLEKAREVFRNSGDLALVLGIMNFRVKKIDAAYGYLKEAAALNRHDPRPYEWMATIARKNGNAADELYYKKEAQRRRV